MKTYKLVALVPLIAFTAFACHGGMHGHDPSKRIDWVAKRIESKLDITAAQKPGFDALVAKVKAEATARQAKGKAALVELKAEVSKPALDIDRIAALAKAQANDRLQPQAIEGFIDEAAAFLKTLSPDQQKKAAELVKDKLDWLD
jgi:hypothetical protein